MGSPFIPLGRSCVSPDLTTGPVGTGAVGESFNRSLILGPLSTDGDAGGDAAIGARSFCLLAFLASDGIEGLRLDDDFRSGDDARPYG